MTELSLFQPLLSGTVSLSASKSISNRMLIIKALTGSKIDIHNLSEAEDTQILNQILSENSIEANAGDAGTVARFLTAFFASREGEHLLTGSERLRERPIRELVDTLQSLGADISYSDKEGFLPLKIVGKKLKGGKISINSEISSQFVSAILMCAPFFENDLEIELVGDAVSLPYIQMTMALLDQFYISSNADDFFAGEAESLIIYKGSYVLPESYTVENDWSSASYWFSAAAMAQKSEIFLPGIKEISMQGDSIVSSLFDSFGVASNFNEKGVRIYKAMAPEIDEFEFDFSDYPDLAMTFAVTCAGLRIPAILTGLSTLRNKESDRLAALKTELERIGCIVKIENSDELHLTPPSGKFNFEEPIQTYNDHRMVMAFAPLVFIDKKIKFDQIDSVKKSYPKFWEDVANCYKTIEIS